jgi:hypothetical protein
MKLLTGEHVSTDWAIVQGETAWCRHTLGVPGLAGTFDYWVIEARARPKLERYCRDWIRTNLSGYTGMVNIETIGGRIIEAHLRFADQWPDLYGRRWLDAVVRLYQCQDWHFADADRAQGYSVVLFGPHGRPYAYPTRTCSPLIGPRATSAACRSLSTQIDPSTPTSCPRAGFVLRSSTASVWRRACACARPWPAILVYENPRLRGNPRSKRFVRGPGGGRAEFSVPVSSPPAGRPA